MNVYQASKSRLSLNSIDRFDFLKMKRSRPSPFDRIDNNNGFGYIVPISINIELDNKKFKDQFLWDVNEPYLKVDHFAKVLATDHDLAPNFEIEVVKFMFKKPNEQAN